MHPVLHVVVDDGGSDTGNPFGSVKTQEKVLPHNHDRYKVDNLNTFPLDFHIINVRIV